MGLHAGECGVHGSEIAGRGLGQRPAVNCFVVMTAKKQFFLGDDTLSKRASTRVTSGMRERLLALT